MTFMTKPSNDWSTRHLGIGRRYAALASRGVRMVFGQSYWHTTPHTERRFAPGALEGYFRDYSGKVDWQGAVDQSGMPLIDLGAGRLLVYPTTVFQKALGHWGEWLKGGQLDAGHKEAFLAAAQWAVDTQDERGGWSCASVLGMNLASEYSAMTQGQGISVLVRADKLVRGQSFLRAARRAMEPMLIPLNEGGSARWAAEGLVLEEAPREPPNTILNGWVYGLFGLYDLALAAPQEPIASEALESTIGALETNLQRFDAGYWSFYDTSGNLASPYYHQVHITQLEALSNAFPNHAAFGETRIIYDRYATSRLNKWRAVAHKVAQKLRRPPEVVVR